MDSKNILELSTVLYISVGILVGFIGRWWLLRGDIRQYPTYPNGYLIHLTTGFIAASIGSVAFPALLANNFVAVTFLTLAIQQFRDIRKMEKESLKSLESDVSAPRGDAYIDGIAKSFEARNYIVMISSLTTTVIIFVLERYLDNTILLISTGVLVGFLVLNLLKNYTKGHHLRDIMTIEDGKLHFKEGSNLYVNDIYVMNVGLSATRERILKNGLCVIMKPNGNSEKIILNHDGQRKAIMHECSRLLGLERYIATRRNFDTGELALVLVPIDKDIDRLKKILFSVPILETVKKEIK
ncbi:YIEGIA domain-containing protein [Vallitalea okinawensis]|uniref:YIEGIA domain-containing protein n=1 Tax=Vallitalea okinawensis TaxID=2078660 RepID=UPI000CFCB306|nr:YIEGIA domain-containing protein [Vallitalea okinawensis]